LPPRVTPPILQKTQANSHNFCIFYLSRFWTSSLCKSANFPGKFPTFFLLASLKPEMLIAELLNHSVYAVELASDLSAPTDFFPL